jgi:predicted extracellular nuclease
MLRSLPILIFFSVFTTAFAFRAALRNDPPVTVVFYNVENLFDTINSPGVMDEDFTPAGKYKWTSERYAKKLQDLAKVLSEATAPALPSVIGLCEVENRKVVEELLATGGLRKGKYKLVHEDSPDARGIDVAFAFRPDVMRLLHHEAIRYGFDFDPGVTTRDILYVKTLAGSDTLHFFVNHWPSRRGGAEESEPRRLVPAGIVRQRSDSLMGIDATARIIIMGDFNDYPGSPSISDALRAAPALQSGLTNLTYNFQMMGKGTYNYRGEWGMLDQFIVSDGLLNATSGLYATDTAVTIFSPDWLLHTDKEGNVSPNRTYGGPNYYGGYSDHLPIVLTLTPKPGRK